jgi:hypothetical protein
VLGDGTVETVGEVLENLSIADQYIQREFPSIKELELIIIGGAAIILKGFENKVTTDIDTIVELEGEVANYLRSFSINNDASEVYVLPDGYKDRLVEYKSGFKVLKIYLVSDEDLVISKVGRFDQNDKEDLEVTGILDKVNTSKLIELGEQVAIDDPEFKNNWKNFRKLSLFE